MPAALLSSAVPFGLIIWHADAMEVGRHGLAVGVQLRLGLLLLLALAVERLVGGGPTTPAASPAHGVRGAIAR